MQTVVAGGDGSGLSDESQLLPPERGESENETGSFRGRGGGRDGGDGGDGGGGGSGKNGADDGGQLEYEEHFHLVDESPRWLLFPQPNADQKYAYQPRPLSLPDSDIEEPRGGGLSRREIFEVLRNVRLFKDITNAELEQLMGLGKLISYPRHSKLVREGTLGSTCFVCITGQLITFSSKAALLDGPPTTEVQRLQAGATLGPTSVFGEAGLVEDVVRDYAVSAVTSCRMWTIDRAALDPIEKHLRPLVMTRLEMTSEWTALKQVVMEGLLSGLAFFGSLVPARRQALASLMTIVRAEAGSVLFREGDSPTRFYIVCDGRVEIHKQGHKLEAASTISSIESKSMRPWFGEVGLFVRKPRVGSAQVAENALLLVVEEINFDAFLSAVPDFRSYLNKSHSQASTVNERASSGKQLTLEQSAIEEQRLREQAHVALKWQSGGLIGGKERDDGADRSIFAERWERIVTALLYMSDRRARPGAGAQYATVSFKTKDYVWKPPNSAPSSPRARRLL